MVLKKLDSTVAEISSPQQQNLVNETCHKILTSYGSKIHFYIVLSFCLNLLSYPLNFKLAFCHHTSAFSTNSVTLANNALYEFCHSIIQRIVYSLLSQKRAFCTHLVTLHERQVCILSPSAVQLSIHFITLGNLFKHFVTLPGYISFFTIEGNFLVHSFTLPRGLFM